MASNAADKSRETFRLSKDSRRSFTTFRMNSMYIMFSPVEVLFMVSVYVCVCN